MYLSWMLGDEDAFYAAFTNGDGKGVVAREVAGQRLAVIENALAALLIADVLTADLIHAALFDRKNPSGLYGLFQHAVHLVTAKHVELRTGPESFNFIFKNHSDDDLYEVLYDMLPQQMLCLSHVIVALFSRMRPMDAGLHHAFGVRSILGLYLIEGGENLAYAISQLGDPACLRCAHCKRPFSITPHNAARIVMSDSYRCVGCRRVNPFPMRGCFSCRAG